MKNIYPKAKEGENVSDKILKLDPEIEQIRTDLSKFLEDNGVKQGHIAKLCSLSDASISLFLSKKRILVQDKLDIIKSIIYK